MAFWRGTAKGKQPPIQERPTLAYDPEHDIVLCLQGEHSSVYSVKETTWTRLPESPPAKLSEMMVFDRRHKVFLATAAMGPSMWAYRYAPLVK